MQVSFGNQMNGNFDLLRGLFTEEDNLTRKIGDAEKQAKETYNKLGLITKIFYPVFGAAEVDAQYKRIASLKAECKGISDKIDRGFAVLEKQEMREISRVVDQVLRGDSSNAAQFERLYADYDKLRAACNSDAERDKIKQLQVNLVWKFLKSGIAPSASWVQKQTTFDDVLTSAIFKSEKGSDEIHDTLLHAVCKAGFTDIVQLLCDHVEPKVFEEVVKSENTRCAHPVDHAVREGHGSVVRVIAAKYPDFYKHMEWENPIAVAIESGKIDLIRSLAETLPRDEFGRLMRWEGNSAMGDPLEGASPLSWAISLDDKEVLEIFEKACPGCVEVERELTQAWSQMWDVKN